MKRYYVFLCKDKKAPYGSFYEDEWFLNSSISAHFIPFESDFVDMTLGNYSWVETANSKASLFIVASGTVLIKHEIFDLAKETTKVAVSKLWPVYCVPSMQMYLLSTRQILQSGLRVEDDKSNSTFYDKSGNAVLWTTPNLWGNIQIVRTCILKHDISNPVSLAKKYLDFETLHCCFGYTSNEVIYHVLDNVEDVKKICFPTQKHVCYIVLLERYINAVSLRTLFASVSL